MLRPFCPQVLLALALVAGPRLAQACEPARATSSAAALPEPWRQAVRDLVRASAEEGRPWGCGGGLVDLALHGGGATLTVTRTGDAPVSRELSSAADLLPLGEALLARPLDDEPPATPEAPPTAPPAAPETVIAAGDPRIPVQLGGGASARYAGGSRAAWLGFGLSVARPFGGWLPALWIRYDTALLQQGPPLEEGAVGLSIARVVQLSQVELRGGISASIAKILRDLPRPEGTETRTDARLGALLAGALPLGRSLRGVLALDAEIAPARKAAEEASGEAKTKPFPRYSLGVGLWLEVAL